MPSRQREESTWCAEADGATLRTEPRPSEPSFSLDRFAQTRCMGARIDGSCFTVQRAQNNPSEAEWHPDAPDMKVRPSQPDKSRNWREWTASETFLSPLWWYSSDNCLVAWIRNVDEIHLFGGNGWWVRKRGLPYGPSLNRRLRERTFGLTPLLPLGNPPEDLSRLVGPVLRSPLRCSSSFSDASGSPPKTSALPQPAVVDSRATVAAEDEDGGCPGATRGLSDATEVFRQRFVATTGSQ